jgi:hypothetical protein
MRLDDVASVRFPQNAGSKRDFGLFGLEEASRLETPSDDPIHWAYSQIPMTPFRPWSVLRVAVDSCSNAKKPASPKGPAGFSRDTSKGGCRQLTGD